MKIHLQKLERGLIFQILEQDKFIKSGYKFNFYLEGKKSYSARDTRRLQVSFHSEVFPELTIITSNMVYNKRTSTSKIGIYHNEITELKVNLRGSDTSRDYELSTFMFKDNRTRDYIYDNLKYSFGKLSKVLPKENI